MATRRAVTQQKQILKAELKAGVREGLYPPGEPAPSLRELAERYQLSRTVVAQVLQDLVQDGVLYSIPRVGTFFGRPERREQGFYLLLLRYPVFANPQYVAVQTGFEAAVAARGGASLVMTLESAQRHVDSGSMPSLAGVFEIVDLPFPSPVREAFLAEAIPYARFAQCRESGTAADSVGFDNEAGGVIATHHLLRLGFRNIAFLGLYAEGASDEFLFSVEREAGWRKAMAPVGADTRRLAFNPPREFSYLHPAQVAAARDAAWNLVRRPEIEAVVVANSFAARGLFEALQLAEVPPALWPTVVAFDDDAFGGESLVSAMRLPWEEIGREAADLLWKRSHEDGSDEKRQVLVPMRLIQRLTCRSSWAASGRGATHFGPVGAVDEVGDPGVASFEPQIANI